MKRNTESICSCRGQNYTLDYSSWTTYANFSDMYNHDYLNMEEEVISTLLDIPQWQDKDGSTTSKVEAYDCKVTHELTHPDYCIVMDQVEVNINVKGDGRIGGEKYFAEASVIPQKKSSRNNKYFALLDLTLLTKDTLTCVVIFYGFRCNLVVEMGIDLFAEEIGCELDDNYIIKNQEKTNDS